LAEISRSLRPQGWANVGVYGEGGYLVSIIKLGRFICKPFSHQFMHRIFKLFTSDPILLTRLLDNFCAPVQKRYSMEEFEEICTNVANFRIRAKAYERWADGLPKSLQWLVTGKEYLHFIMSPKESEKNEQSFSFACPKCDSRPKLIETKDSLNCPQCDRTYPVEDGIPVLIA